jgi:hypothetical protein
MDWRLDFSLWNILATRVTDTFLCPNKYQNVTHLETDISASPVTNVNKGYTNIYRIIQKHNTLIPFNMRTGKDKMEVHAVLTQTSISFMEVTQDLSNAN